jgi:hypothetical protein
MRRVLRRHLLAIACFAAAGVIGIAAIADHRLKQRHLNHAELLRWYCVHEGTRCGGPSPRRIEARWNDRQLGYEIAVSALGGVALVLLLARTVRR